MKNIPRDQGCNSERCTHEEEGDDTDVEGKAISLYTKAKSKYSMPIVKNRNHGTKVEEKVLNVLR